MMRWRGVVVMTVVACWCVGAGAGAGVARAVESTVSAEQLQVIQAYSQSVRVLVRETLELLRKPVAGDVGAARQERIGRLETLLRQVSSMAVPESVRESHDLIVGVLNEARMGLEILGEPWADAEIADIIEDIHSAAVQALLQVEMVAVGEMTPEVEMEIEQDLGLVGVAGEEHEMAPGVAETLGQ